MKFKEVKIENSNQNQEKIIKDKKSILDYINFGFFSKITNFINKEKIRKYGPSVFLLIAIILYLLSLEGCTMLEYECVAAMNLSFFFRLVVYLLICCFLTSIIFFFAIKNLISKIYLYLTLIIFFFLLLSKGGQNLKNHGDYNRFFFVLINILLLFIYQILFLFFIYLIQKQYKKFIILNSIIFIVITYFYINFHDCSYFNLGLSDISIINDKNKDKCKIRNPNFCVNEYFNGKLDLNLFSNENCGTIASSKEMLFKFAPQLKNQGNSFIFPDTTFFDFITESTEHTFQKVVLQRVIPNKEGFNFTGKKEIFIDFEDKSDVGKITINLTRNETLVKERKKNAEKYKVKYETILLIYTDAISRRQFLRNFPKTSKIINEYIIDNKNKKEKYNAFQFMKYINFRDSTKMNTLPMFYGTKLGHGGKHIIKYLKTLGYITGHSENIQSREIYILDSYMSQGIEYEAFDHENSAIFCDPNHVQPDTDQYAYQGPNSLFRRCLYGMEASEIVIEYGKQFLEKYKDSRKYFRMAFMDGHESTKEVAKYVDRYLYKFVDFFLNNLMNDKTAVFFISDHGNNMPTIGKLIGGEDELLERALGNLILLIPNEHNQTQINNLKYNQQILVTPYDIYETLLDMSVYDKQWGSENNKGESLFNKINGLERDCEKYDDWDQRKQYFCVCDSWEY